MKIFIVTIILMMVMWVGICVGNIKSNSSNPCEDVKQKKEPKIHFKLKPDYGANAWWSRY